MLPVPNCRRAGYPELGFSKAIRENYGWKSRFVCSMVGEMNEASRKTATKPIGLHVCPACGSQLVQPTCWEQSSPRGHWRLWRRCPECEWNGDGVHGEREIDAYDEELDGGAEELATELEALEREGMERVAAAFATALAADLIGADDFRVRVRGQA